MRQIFALADAIEPRSRALVLLATFGSLRWGELAAMTGASLKGLTARMGHSSTKAVLVYLHAAKDRDRAIADALGEIVEEGFKPEEDEFPAKSKIN